MKTFLKVIGVAALGAACIAGLVWVSMLLWNAIIPGLTGWSTITFWQTAGLCLLFRLITGHFGFSVDHARHHHHKHNKHRHQMNKEQRERFFRRWHPFPKMEVTLMECRKLDDPDDLDDFEEEKNEGNNDDEQCR